MVGIRLGKREEGGGGRGGKAGRVRRKEGEGGRGGGGGEAVGRSQSPIPQLREEVPQANFLSIALPRALYVN